MKALSDQPVAANAINPFDKLPSFSWVGYVMASFAVFGAFVGPERMMDAFEKIVHVESKVAEEVNRH
jgi:hypothetical protein